MPSRLSSTDALMLHVIAHVERCDVNVHRSGLGHLEVYLDTKGRYVTIEDNGQVLEWHGRGDPRPWPTDDVVERDLRAEFPSVARRLDDAHARLRERRAARA